MSIPDAAVTFLLENLSQAITYNVKLITGAEDKFTVLQRELESLSALMKDFTKYNHDSDYIEDKVKRIREILCEAEDAVDSYLIHAAVKASQPWVSKWFHNVTDYPIVLRDIGKRIRDIGDEVRKVNEECSSRGTKILKYQAIRSLDHAATAKPKQAPIVEEDHVIGFEGAIEAVTNLVSGGAEQFEAISIVGMLGLGKTTLAKQVYKDQRVEYDYRIRAFVYVSQEYERKDIFHRILLSLNVKIDYDVEKATDEYLEKHLHRELSGKKYLIVLDDMWVKGDWDKLRGAFPRNKTRCRVLITTRNEEVANYANPRIGCFRLDFLKPDKSKELLRWKVFEGGDFPSEMEDCEATILLKCDGLPLAIVVIAGILCNDRHSVEHWKDVAKGVQGYIARDATKTTDVILVMYKHLPNHLKRCFLYMGVFKEDSEIPVWKLVRLWIAEGLVEEEEGYNLEDVAWRNMRELVYRNLVMVAKRSSNGRTKTCRMHDTLREFCKKEAEQENLFREIKKDNLAFFKSQKDALVAYRRLCINTNNVVDYISSTPSGKCVRSFLTFNKDKTPIESNQVSSLPKAFRLLRVMEVESLVFIKFPPQLCHLVLLKYVAISSHFTTLPKDMSNMWNLQTLIVNTTKTPLQVSANIWEMPQLRHLHTNVSTILPSPPPPDAKKSKLHIQYPLIQTLSSISPESCTRDVFIRTPEIKKLGVRGTGVMKLFEAQSALFGILASLETFKLQNDDASAAYPQPISDALLSHLSFPQQLMKLTLQNTRFSWKEMSALGNLKKLEILKLKSDAFQGGIWVTEEGGFPLLKHLHIGRTELTTWEVANLGDDDHVLFPKLRRLELHYCDKLQGLPRALADITTLQVIDLYCTNALLVASAKSLKEEHSTFNLSVYPPESH